MILLVHEYLTHAEPKTLDQELMPPNWGVEPNGAVTREEGYQEPMGGPHEFDGIQTELDTLYSLGVRGSIVFADDIEHSVFEICLGATKMYKDYLSLAPQGNAKAASLPLDAFGQSIYVTNEIELPPNDMEKVMLVLELNAARINSQLKAYGLPWNVDYVAGNAMRVISDGGKGIVTDKRDAVQLVVGPSDTASK